MRRVFDSFLLFNEIDLALLRLETLHEVVDTFVIVECAMSHGGIPKPFFFEIYKDRFAKYLPKIHYYKLHELPPLRDESIESRTELGIYNYNKMYDALKECAASSDDIVIISDLDEIPDPVYVSMLPHYLSQHSHVVFVQTYMKYFVNHLQYFNLRDWAGCVACRFRQVELETPMGIRRGQKTPRSAHLLFGTRPSEHFYLENSGWHFTYFGGAAAVATKYRNSLEELGDLSYNQIPPLVDIDYNAFDRRKSSPELVQWISTLSDQIIPMQEYNEVSELFPNLPPALLKEPDRYPFCFWLEQ